ncbi:MAG TPA: VOC family protein [Acetobacteraceae bacterium]|nr:VOC family protein [Acetobacteraceae bacterium]
MFSHVTIGANDLARLAPFYDAFLAPLGIGRVHSDEQLVGWGREGEPGQLFVGTPFNGEAATAGNGWMCAFRAPSREAVTQAHAAALAHGGSDEGAPGLRPHYAPDYFGAYVRDPEGNKLHVVHRGG